MSLIIRILFVAALCVAMYSATDLYVGTTTSKLVHSQHVELLPIFMVSRSKSVFVSTNDTREIRGVQAIDLENTDAVATVTAGGVGSTFVNVLLKSSRGEGLNYFIQIYA